MREFNIIVTNVIIWVLTYLALFEHSAGAYNVVLFIISLYFIIAIAMNTKVGVNSLVEAKKKNSPLAPLINYTDLALACLFVWFGHWIIAIALVLMVALTASGWDKVDAINKENVT